MKSWLAALFLPPLLMQAQTPYPSTDELPFDFRGRKFHNLVALLQFERGKQVTFST